jgi:dTDP-4-amino-4,6-dideoxygalactose transaminase
MKIEEWENGRRRMYGDAVMTTRSKRAGSERLAIDGGPPARRRPDPPMYPGGNMIGAEEEQAVLEVLRSKRLFRYYGPEAGPSKVAQLEEAFAAHMGARHAVAVSSGTAALMCGLAGIGVGPGDEVIVPAYTWVASATAVVMMGGIPILAEVDDSLTLDPADVARKITPRSRAIMPVHMRGAPARMDELLGLARQHGLRVLEDVAQADGGSYLGRRLGTLGDVGCFSLQFNKIITCGEGGVVTTSDDEVHTRVVMFQDPVGGLRNNVPEEEILLGMNFRMPELSGAVALAQLGRLDALIDTMLTHKHALKAGMADALAGSGGHFRTIADVEGDTGIALIFFMPSAELADRVVQALRAENVGASGLYRPDRTDYHVYPHWGPILAQRTWSAQGGPWRWGAPLRYHAEMSPRTLDLLSRAVHLDVNPLLTEEDIDETISGLNKVLDAIPFK